ncbi:DEAD/DEAH box helicase [Microvirga sp. G4-2]|uniref:DEAD/DEAH box helicase n=1 Tax=Microvirga sp. G4-2 TaxID=3434467 RepID=UPI00404450D7
MTIQLRPFQEDMIASIRAELRRHQSVLAQLPTGGGKTVLSAFMMRSARSKGLRAWFVCNRDFLIDQTSQTLDNVGVDHAFIAAGWPWHAAHPTQICSINTLVKRLHLLTPPDLIVWDEAHHIAAGSWAKVFAWAAKSKHILLSATPVRLDGRGLNDYAGAMVRGPDPAWLMDQGYLSRYRAFAPSMPDLSGVKSRMGDYAKGELDDAMDRSAIIGDMVNHYRHLAAGKRAVYFAVSIKHSQHIADTFNAAGIPAMHLDGNTGRAERAMAAQALARGDLMVLSNVDLFGEGYDLSAQAGMSVTIEAVGLARPTQSLGLHLQQVGRALRPKGEPAIILDHAGNLLRHGLPDDEREWKLEGMERKSKTQSGSVKQCPSCFGVHKAGLPKCSYCGHDYRSATPQAREVEQIDGVLEEVDPVRLREARKAEEKEAKTVEDLISLGKRRGYKDPVGWAANMMTVRAKYAKGRQAAAARRMEHQVQTQRWW